jgi:hypothetical protein
MMERIEEFKTLLRNTERAGIESLLTWLETTDFFSSPASTQYHGAFKGGLLEHSLTVHAAMHLFLKTGLFDPAETRDSSIAICSLLHDVCKIGRYRRGVRNVKVNGAWVQKDVWEYVQEDPYPYGHGEKSVELIRRHIDLSDDEALAVRWHMGPWEECDKKTCSKALERPLALLLHMADMVASKILEARPA